MVRRGIGFAAALAAALGMLAGCRGAMQPQHHVRAVLQAAPDKTHPWPKSAAAQRALMEEARQVVLNRAKGARGISSAEVSVRGNDSLVLELASVSPDVSSVPRRLTSIGQLEFYWLKDVQNTNNPLGRWRAEAPIGGSEKSYTFTDAKGETIDSVRDPQAVLAKVVGVPNNKPVLTGRDVLPTVTANINQANQIVINMEFNRSGTEVFRNFTRTHVGDYLAVFFDGKLLTAPTINEAIPSGKAEISGFRSLAEARTAAEYLNAGALPVPLKVVEVNR